VIRVDHFGCGGDPMRWVGSDEVLVMLAWGVLVLRSETADRAERRTSS
jgi:hypothetical protein